MKSIYERLLCIYDEYVFEIAFNFIERQLNGQTFKIVFNFIGHLDWVKLREFELQTIEYIFGKALKLVIINLDCEKFFEIDTLAYVLI